MLDLLEIESDESPCRRYIETEFSGAGNILDSAFCFKVRLFGDPELLTPKERILLPVKAFQLIAFLSLEPDFTASRRKVAAVLWDSPSEHHAFNSLRQLLARIRKVFPAKGGIETSGAYISIGKHFQTSDLLLEIDELRNWKTSPTSDLANHRRGELLEGLDSSTTLQYQEWLHLTRAKLDEDYLDCASKHLFQATRFGRAHKGEIEPLAEKMLEVAPEREETYRTLIEVFGRVGDLGKARKLYSDLVEMLDAEHRTAPDTDTAAVARRVFASARSDSPKNLILRTESPPPRVAILMPEWLINQESLGLFRAMIANVTDELSRYRSFQVLGPHSSLKALHEFGALSDNTVLRADYTISGFAQIIDGLPVLSLRLAQSSTLEVAWSGEFQFSTEDLISTHRRLTTRIAKSLASALENDRIRQSILTDEPNAYTALLTGVDAMMVCDLPQLRRARRHFSNAIDIDCHFATAYSELAKCLLYEWLILGANDPVIVSGSRSNARTALDIDPNDGLILATMATIELYQHEVDRSLDLFVEAETLCPNSSELLVGYASALSTAGRPNQGLEKFERAISINPASPDDHWWAGASIAFDAHQYQRAIDYCAMMQNDDAALRVLTASHALVGNVEKARECASQLKEIYPDQTAVDMVGITPIQDREVYDRFLEGLRISGIN